MAFAPDYIRLVLAENFADAKALFLEPLLAIHDAHLVMLAERRIVSPGDARAIRDALRAVDVAAVRNAAYDGTCEDLYFYVDRLLAAACGPDVAGRLHTARSRNDIDMAMYRMRQREWLLGLMTAVLELRRSLADLADRHVDTVVVAHTHAQPAQPTTVAHYLASVSEMLERDTARLRASYASTNMCPLGACAITGTGFPIDRARTSDLLGFDGPTGNTYGSIATIDYLLEGTTASATLLVGLGRFVQDMLLWSTVEVGYLRLPDALVQVSSIMPQKRNPVALEHTRALSSRAWAEMQAIGQVPHNTPFGDIVDTEDDLQPLVALAYHDAERAVSLAALTMRHAELDRERMRARAADSWVTVTELADQLVQSHGLSFRLSHDIVSRFVRSASRAEPRVETLRRVSRDAGQEIVLTDAVLDAALSPDAFVAARRTLGGPAPDVVRDALAVLREGIDRDDADTARAREALDDAARRRRTAVDAL